MNERTKRIVTMVLAFACVAGAVMTVVSYLDSQESQKAYEMAIALASMPTETVTADTQPTVAPEETTLPEETAPLQWVPETIEDDLIMMSLRSINLEALRQVNPAVVGWISIPNTKIHFPVTQGEDNSYYLSHTWDLKYNIAGGIFLETQNSKDMTDFNTIIYGHNMVNGSMFTDLMLFEDPEFVANNPYVYLVTDEGIWRYEIFATHDAPVESRTYWVSFEENKFRKAYIQHALEMSYIDTGITPELTDRILTLSTCNGISRASRRVVQARLRMVQQ